MSFTSWRLVITCAALNGCRAGLWISLLATRLVVHHLESERFSAKARERLSSRQSVGSSVNPVNVHLVEPTCEGFGSSAGTFDTDMAGVIVAVGVVWCIVQRAYAQYALATYSLTNLSHLSLGEAGTIPIVGGTSCSVCRKQALVGPRNPRSS